MNKAERVSKLAARFGALQKAIKKEGLTDVSDKMVEASLILVKHGLDEYIDEYVEVKK